MISEKRIEFSAKDWENVSAEGKRKFDQIEI